MADAASADPELLLEHAEFLRRVAYRVLGSRGDSDDAVQDAFVAALTDGSTQTTGRAWLSSVTWRRAKDIQRCRAVRRRRETMKRVAPLTPSTGELVARAEIGRLLMSAVLELDAIYCDVLLFRFYEGLPPRKVAARLSVPVETVRTRTKRALAMLRERLDDRHEGGRAGWVGALAPLVAAAPRPVSSLAPGLAALLVFVVVGASWLLVGPDSGDSGSSFRSAPHGADDGPVPHLEVRGSVTRDDVSQDDGGDQPASPTDDPHASPPPSAPLPPSRVAPGRPGEADTGRATRGLGDVVVHVRDQDDAPVPGATVYLVPAGRMGSFVDKDDLFELGRTDLSGSLAVRGLPAGEVGISADYGGNLWRLDGLRALLDGRQGQVARLIADEETSVSLVVPLRMSALATLEGRVTDPQGRPVRGAMVYASGPRVRTGANGWYRIPGLRPGTHRFAVSKTGHELVSGDTELKPGMTRERDVTLRYSASGSLELEGRVVAHDGHPLRDFVVRFEAGAAGYLRIDHTDADGRFGMYELPDAYATETFVISAFPSDGHVATRTVTFDGVPTGPVQIQMDPPRMEVTLRVIDDVTNRPITAIRYALQEPSLHYPRLHAAESPTGAYVRQLEPGSYPVRVEALGYEHHLGELVVSEAGEHVVRMTPVTDNTPRFDMIFCLTSGRDGSPIEKCQFALGPFTAAMGETEPDHLPRGKGGRYGWSLPVGAYMLTVFKKGYVAHMAQVLVEDGGEAKTLRISLEPEGGPEANPAWLSVYRNR